MQNVSIGIGGERHLAAEMGSNARIKSNSIVWDRVVDAEKSNSGLKAIALRLDGLEEMNQAFS